MIEKDYFVTWGAKGLPMVLAMVARISHPPHDEPKGEALQALMVEAAYNHSLLSDPDHINIYSAAELPSAVWCQGRTAEVVVGGRAASLEAGPGGWRIHI